MFTRSLAERAAGEMREIRRCSDMQDAPGGFFKKADGANLSERHRLHKAERWKGSSGAERKVEPVLGDVAGSTDAPPRGVQFWVLARSTG